MEGGDGEGRKRERRGRKRERRGRKREERWREKGEEEEGMGEEEEGMEEEEETCTVLYSSNSNSALNQLYPLHAPVSGVIF